MKRKIEKMRKRFVEFVILNITVRWILTKID